MSHHRLVWWRRPTGPSEEATAALEASEQHLLRGERVVGALEHEVLVRNHIGERLLASLSNEPRKATN